MLNRLDFTRNVFVDQELFCFQLLAGVGDRQSAF
jgi:hypothetical protein